MMPLDINQITHVHGFIKLFHKSFHQTNNIALDSKYIIGRFLVTPLYHLISQAMF